MGVSILLTGSIPSDRAVPWLGLPALQPDFVVSQFKFSDLSLLICKTGVIVTHLSWKHGEQKRGDDAYKTHTQ